MSHNKDKILNNKTLIYYSNHYQFIVFVKVYFSLFYIHLYLNTNFRHAYYYQDFKFYSFLTHRVHLQTFWLWSFAGKELNFILAAHNHRATVCLCGQAGQYVHIRFCEALTRCDSAALTQRSTYLVHFSAFSIYNASVEISLFQNGQWCLSFSFPTSPSLCLTHTHTKPRWQTHAHLLAVMLILMVINDITTACGCTALCMCVCEGGWWGVAFVCWANRGNRELSGVASQGLQQYICCCFSPKHPPFPGESFLSPPFLSPSFPPFSMTFPPSLAFFAIWSVRLLPPLCQCVAAASALLQAGADSGEASHLGK